MSSQDRGSETREDNCFYAVVEAPFEHLQQPDMRHGVNPKTTPQLRHAAVFILTTILRKNIDITYYIKVISKSNKSLNSVQNSNSKLV